MEELSSQQKLDIIVKCIDYGAPALKEDLINYLNNVLSLANIYLSSQAVQQTAGQEEELQDEQGSNE